MANKKSLMNSFTKSEEQINQDLMKFINESPTPFHVVAQLESILKEHQFECLDESRPWKLKELGRYYVTKNNSSLIAFVYKNKAENIGFHIVGAHTDSPCLKVRPKPVKTVKNFFQLGVDIYGGALFAPWFDRDLSLAGRLNVKNNKGELSDLLIDFKRPIAIIPSLAIHLNRTVNENHAINPQKELPPILMQYEGKAPLFNDLLLEEVKKQKLSKDIAEVIDYELSFYDTMPSSYVGLNNDFIAASRLDNLLSTFAGLQGLLSSLKEINKNGPIPVLVALDHEEVGSCSHVGADGPFLQNTLERLCENHESYLRAISLSTMISCDNAHGVHPNYLEKHEENHGPILNQGPVIKINANQRYATNGQTSALFSHLCQQLDVPFQKFVVRADMACGSTIGPITASKVGLKVVDVGAPTFAMHSIRELCGRKDVYYLAKVLNLFFSQQQFF